MQPEAIATFSSDLEQQLTLYREIMDLNQAQFEMLDAAENPDTDAMVTFIGRKQNTMQRLELLDKRLAPQKEVWRNDREGVAEGPRAEVDALLETISETIRALITMEDEAQSRLESLMVVNTASVDNIRRKAQVNRAYSAYGANRPKPRFIDKRADDA